MSRSLLWATGSQFQYDFQETVHNRDQQTTALESNLAYHLFLYPLQSGAQLQQSSTVSHGGQVQMFPFFPYFSCTPSTCLLSQWLHLIAAQELCQLPPSHWALLCWQLLGTKHCSLSLCVRDSKKSSHFCPASQIEFLKLHQVRRDYS